ncbi:poly-beta-hydroxybutyrate polymerase N-terminal domain-containing protein [Diaphorobacter sp. NR2-3-3-1]|nr:poly-beta-hydroxybutyrate polymerase N-terminal domain-containing protein [Diaphorobacter caeni]
MPGNDPWASFENLRRAFGAQNWDDRVRGHMSRSAMGLSPIALALAGADWALHIAAAPGKQKELAHYAMRLAGQRAIAGLKNESEVVDESVHETDSRFRAPEWSHWPYRMLKDHFTAVESWWQDAVQVDGMNRHHARMVDFFARQWLDALAPSNWIATNPEVLSRLKETHGKSLMQGWQYLMEDAMEAGKALSTEPAQDTLKPLEFVVGQDVAVTPGKVVFRNHLIELIHYAPLTAKVHPEPVLIVPSCIMKYYILDLSPHNSMVKYLLEQGHQVYMISWRNPNASDRHLAIEDYLSTGVLAAMQAVGEVGDARRIHAMGYCLGGTFLSIVAATLGRIERQKAEGHAPAFNAKQERLIPDHLPQLASCTLLAAQTDFSEPGELGVFIDEDQLATLRQKMNAKGYMSGKDMGGSFQFLSSRDLVWSRNMRRYLLGEAEASFDLMSWNADQTRLPADMHAEYLSAMFLDNALACGKYHFAGSAVALMDINVPLFVVATKRDHVAPWRSVYGIHLQTSTPVTFVLAAGGHNAGIVSEPGRPRRSYQISTEPRERHQSWTAPDDWAMRTPVTQGSWWEAMHAWLQQHSGEPKAPKKIKPEHQLCDAPGDYVRVRYAD